jgi:hypothetical protein
MISCHSLPKFKDFHALRSIFTFMYGHLHEIERIFIHEYGKSILHTCADRVHFTYVD